MDRAGSYQAAAYLVLLVLLRALLLAKERHGGGLGGCAAARPTWPGPLRTACRASKRTPVHGTHGRVARWLILVPMAAVTGPSSLCADRCGVTTTPTTERWPATGYGPPRKGGQLQRVSPAVNRTPTERGPGRGCRCRRCWPARTDQPATPAQCDWWCSVTASTHVDRWLFTGQHSQQRVER